MTNNCPNCNQELGPDDTFCPNCGTARPQPKPPIEKKPTMILSQREAGQTAPIAAPVSTVEAPVVDVAEPEPEAAPEPATPSLAVWKCPQCGLLNAEASDYCEHCGALAPSATPTDRYADTLPPGTVTHTGDTTTKLPTEVIAALAADPQVIGWNVVSANGTNEGLGRHGLTNEDSHFVLELRRMFESRPEVLGFYIVADGMGGQAAGEVASRMAIGIVASVVVNELAGRWASGEALHPDQAASTLRGAISLAHNKLREYNASEGIDAGTTMTACLVAAPWAVFANVGDSRTYLLRQPNPASESQEKATDPILPAVKTEDTPTEPLDVTNLKAAAQREADEQTDKLNPDRLSERETVALSKPQLVVERVTRDHSLVQELVEQGRITQDDVYSHPNRNVILYALGAPDDVPVDTFYRDLKDGDTILLCSDGLWEMVRDPEIARLVLENPNLDHCVSNLIDLANENGGADNITVVAVRSEKILVG